MLGLQRPTRGRVWLFDRPLDGERVALLRRVGSLVESPSVYLDLTGRENLDVHRRLLGIPKASSDEALERVGLVSIANRLVRNYSSGMKQRLGLAQALLGGPELLLLDEPTNGLDPAGIHEVRSLMPGSAQTWGYGFPLQSSPCRGGAGCNTSGDYFKRRTEVRRYAGGTSEEEQAHDRR